MEEKSIELTEGSKYKISSLHSKDKVLITTGIFKGFTKVGEMDALCIELGKEQEKLAGKTRVIPSHMVLAIDILKPAEKKEEKEKLARYLG